MGWFVVALGLRLLALLAIHIFSLNRGYGGFYPMASGHDDGFYFESAADMARGYTYDVLPNIYPRVLSYIFVVTGPNLLVGKLFNAVAGALCVLVGLLLVRDVNSDSKINANQPSSVYGSAHWAGALLTFYPSHVWYSTQLIKDPILILLGLSGLWLAVRCLQRPHFFEAILWLAVWYWLYLFRSYAALSLAAALLLFTIRFRRAWLIPLGLLAALGPMAMGWGVFGWGLIEPWLNAEKLEGFRESAYSIGGSAAGISLDYSSPVRFIPTYLYSFFTLVFGPFPWQLRSGSQAIALVDGVMIWMLAAVWFKGTVEIWRGDKDSRSKSVLPMLFSIILCFAIALFSDNIGSNTRLRMLPWCAFFIYAAPFLQHFFSQRLSLPRRFYSRSLQLPPAPVVASPSHSVQSAGASSVGRGL
jgi:hypothetical protein